MIRLAALLSALLLAGCNAIGWPKPAPETAATASAWTKPGADAATVESAYSDCLAASNTATKTDFDIDQDTSATRASDLEHSDFARTQMQDLQAANRDRAQTILSSCMADKGFSSAR